MAADEMSPAMRAAEMGVAIARLASLRLREAQALMLCNMVEGRHIPGMGGCPSCRGLVLRLTPVSELLREYGSAAPPAVTVRRWEHPPCDCRWSPHSPDCPLTPIWAATVTDMGVDPDVAMRMRLSERYFPTMWRRA